MAIDSVKPAASEKAATTATAPKVSAPKVASPNKPAAKKAAPAKAASKPAKVAAPKAVAPASAKKVSPPKAASKPKAAAKPAAKPDTKPAKVKMERDSFTMPKDEYAQIANLKDRLDKMGQPAKKSELLRAGIKLLVAMSANTLKTTMAKIPVIKTGRPKKK